MPDGIGIVTKAFQRRGSRVRIRTHAATKTSQLLGRIVYEMRGVSRGANVESVHHMRVAIRRLLQCLRFFAGMFPQGKVKKIRRDLKRLMTLSAEVRDRDIALSLLAQIGVPKDSEVMTALAGQRRKAAKRLETAAKLWKDKERSRKWRAQLSL